MPHSDVLEHRYVLRLQNIASITYFGLILINHDLESWTSRFSRQQFIWKLCRNIQYSSFVYFFFSVDFLGNNVQLSSETLPFCCLSYSFFGSRFFSSTIPIICTFTPGSYYIFASIFLDIYRLKLFSCSYDHTQLLK